MTAAGSVARTVRVSPAASSRITRSVRKTGSGQYSPLNVEEKAWHGNWCASASRSRFDLLEPDHAAEAVEEEAFVDGSVIGDHALLDFSKALARAFIGQRSARLREGRKDCRAAPREFGGCRAGRRMPAQRRSLPITVA